MKVLCEYLSANLKNIQKYFFIFIISYLTSFYFVIINKIEPFASYLNTIGAFGDFISSSIIFIAYLISQHSKDEEIYSRAFIWKYLFIGSLFYFWGDSLWAYTEDFLHKEVIQPGFVSVLYVIDTIFCLIAFIFYIKQIKSKYWHEDLFDLFIIVLSSIGIIFNLILVPIINAENIDSVMKSYFVFHVIIDLFFVFCTIMIALGARESVFISKSNIFFFLTFVCFVITDQVDIIDALYGWGDFVDYIQPVYPSAYFFLGMAALNDTDGRENLIPLSMNNNLLIEELIYKSKIYLPHILLFSLLISFGVYYKITSLFFLWAVILVLSLSIRQIIVFKHNDSLLLEFQRSEYELQEKNKKLEELNEKIKFDSEIDFLTQLYNRRAIDKKLNNFSPKLFSSNVQVERRKSEAGEHDGLGIMLIDIDFFKKINDIYGHDSGDLVLKKVANSIQMVTREKDIAGRYGGDEFIVLLMDVNIDSIKIVADRLVNFIRNNSYLSSKGVTISIGCAVWDFNDKDFTYDKLLKRADEALYVSKENGRNQYLVRE